MREKVINIKQIQYIESEMARHTSRILDEHNIYYSLAYGSVLGAIRHGGPIPWDIDMDMYIRFDEMWKVIKVLRDNLPEPYTVDFYDVNSEYNILYPRVSLRKSSSYAVHIDLFTLCGLPQEEQERNWFWEKINRIDKIYYRYKHETSYVRKTNRTKWKYIIKFCLAKGKEIVYLPITYESLRKKYMEMFSKYSIDESQHVAADPMIKPSREIIRKEILFRTTLHKYNDLMLVIPEDYDSYLTQQYGEYMIPDERFKDILLKYTAIISEDEYNIFFKQNLELSKE